MSLNYSADRDVTAIQRHSGIGMASTWVCGRCNESRGHTLGRRSWRIKGRRVMCCQTCVAELEAKERKAPAGTRKAAILAFLKTCGKHGATPREVCEAVGIEQTVAATLLKYYRKHGGAVKRSAGRYEPTYFLAESITDAELAEFNAALHPEPPKPAPNPRARPFVGVVAGGPVHCPELGVTVERVNGVKITRAAPLLYDPRFQVDPNGKHHGAGFSAVGIGRDVDTGRAWGQ